MKTAPGHDGITYEMMDKGEEEISPILLHIYNNIMHSKEEKPEDWILGEIISIFKGKGRREEMSNQRGITLTVCILKCLEMMIAKRIDPMIKNKSTPLQGGGKRDEAVEEYLFAIQTIIDINLKENKYTSLMITDVAKAFDQAWRVGVFKNLVNRGIQGRLLNLIWLINDNLKARIKKDQMVSNTLEVEESIRQGSSLSAILYAQHAGTLIEDLQKEELGLKIGNMFIPAIGWQDDITMIAKNKDEETKMSEVIEESSKRNRIYFSNDKKCNIVRMGRKNEEVSEIKIGEIILEEREEAKVLGHYFNNENNNNAHIREKSKEATDMVASMGLSMKNSHMGRMFIQSMIVIYQKCFIPKLLYGLTGFKINKTEMDTLGRINRTILRNFLSIPQSTPKVAIYVELGINPIETEIKKRKLQMWHRINRKESNEMIKNIKRIQINEGMPWMREITSIAMEYNLDLMDASKDSKGVWKQKVKKRIAEKTKQYLKEEMVKTKHYKENVTDEIVIGKQKQYMYLPTKITQAVFRARAGILDPEPRKPYWKKIWKCKFCKTREQTSKHYIKECRETRKHFNSIAEREEIWRCLSKLEEMDKIERMGEVIYKIYRQITSQ